MTLNFSQCIVAIWCHFYPSLHWTTINTSPQKYDKTTILYKINTRKIITKALFTLIWTKDWFVQTNDNVTNGTFANRDQEQQFPYYFQDINFPGTKLGNQYSITKRHTVKDQPPIFPLKWTHCLEDISTLTQLCTATTFYFPMSKIRVSLVVLWHI